MKTQKILSAAFVLLYTLLANAQEQFPKTEQPSRIKEFGIGFANFNSFSLQYRWGNEQRLYRLTGNISSRTSLSKSKYNEINIADTTFSSIYTNEKEVTPLSLNAGLNFSVLKLKSVSERFGFLYGVNVGLSFSYLKFQDTYTLSNTYSYESDVMTTSSTNQQIIRPSVGIALGGFYKISSSFWLYAEIDPNIYYQFILSNSSTKQGTGFFGMPPVSNSINASKSHSHEFGVSNLSNSLASLTLVYRFKRQ